ncbi:hypothetical protein [Gemmatimonas sp.]|uniref:hypothetical protein n=1 Tax=Gemmatimonas sp. TaxID=1962908 RepID=UPI00286C8760|nr:hypothetical protein [Gemmatimonas sp.]
MHLDEHVEGIDAEYGGGGGGGKHGESVRCGVRNTVIGTAHAWSFGRMGRSLPIRFDTAHVAVQSRTPRVLDVLRLYLYSIVVQ